MPPPERSALGLDGDLPIAELLPEITAVLGTQHRLIVEAPPGAGKTTQVPLSLLDAPWLEGQRIVMLQPRRLAARNAALRMAQLLGEKAGETVGYRMRQDSRVSDRTRIEVITEGVLLRMLQDDPELSGTGLLIFDEFHERSLDADLGLSLTLHACSMFREERPLRLCVMSATLDQTGLQELLNAHSVRSEGRIFPVTTHYDRPYKSGDRIASRTAACVERALSVHGASSVLAFLPGQAEIRRTAAEISSRSDVSVYQLYGDLAQDEQRRALEPCDKGRRKVVLATNIAETSLTIDGVDVVVDSGLERTPVYDPNTGMSRLQTVRISQASAQQRRGRAGRLRPGYCYRLWSESQQDQLRQHHTPEILNADLSSMVLQLFAWGIHDPSELSWVSSPPPGPYAQALDLLRRLGAISDTSGSPSLSAHGHAMAALATHPRLAHMLLQGQATGFAQSAALLAAALSERNPLGRKEPDLRSQLEYLTGETRCPQSLRPWMDRCQKLADQLQRQLPGLATGTRERPARADMPGYLIACAFPDRIARRRHSGGYLLTNGRGCRFDDSAALAKERWLAVAEVFGRGGSSSDIIAGAVPLNETLLENVLAELVTSDTVADWDTKSGRFVAERQRRCGHLVLSREKLPEIPVELRIDKLVELTREQRMKNLPWNRDSESFRARGELMASIDSAWPAFDEPALLDTLEEWLAPFLTSVQKISDLKQLDLLEMLSSRLTWEQKQQLETALPQRMSVPSGSKIRVDYTKNPPVLAVKLQEMFGCKASPRLADGRLSLLIHLLSPAGRPLQVTEDLASFWQSGYLEVKKEMKGRYPKHPWPDDPVTAKPTRHTKRRGS